MTPEEADDLIRFMCKVERAGDGCWIWKKPNLNGYGKFRYQGRPQWAHRVAYRLLVGPIPEGMTLDHLCRTPACVNPSHLEPVSHRENVLRGTSPAALAAARDACIRGHRYTPENTYVQRDGSRRCRACARLLGKERDSA